jgi:hypothetical protein
MNIFNIKFEPKEEVKPSNFDAEHWCAAITTVLMLTGGLFGFVVIIIQLINSIF